MTLQEALEMLKRLNELKCTNGKRYTHISKLLNSEATTHNIKEAKKLLSSIDG